MSLLRGRAAIVIAQAWVIAMAGSGVARSAVTFECELGVPAATMVLFDGHDHLRVPSTAEAEISLATLAGEGVSLPACWPWAPPRAATLRSVLICRGRVLMPYSRSSIPLQ